MLLLELFPLVAKTFLTNMKVKAYEASKPATCRQGRGDARRRDAGRDHGQRRDGSAAGPHHRTQSEGRRRGEGRDQEVAVLEAMKMENAITSDFAGTVKQILVRQGQTVATDAVLMEIE